MEFKTVLKIGGAFIVGIIVLVLSLGSFYTIQSGSKGIVLRTGKAVSVASDGLNFKLPILDSVTKVNVQTLKAEAEADASTKDLQTAHTKVAINYHLDSSDTALLETYTKFGLSVESKIIDPRVQEVVKAVTAQYSAEELVTKRAEVKDKITTDLRKDLAKYNVILEETNITNFKFSDAFAAAIEEKQTAEQKALKARNDLERIRVEGEQKVVSAKADAESIRVQSEAVRAQGGKEYVQLKAIEKWDGVLPTTVTDGSNLFLNIK